VGADVRGLSVGIIIDGREAGARVKARVAILSVPNSIWNENSERPRQTNARLSRAGSVAAAGTGYSPMAQVAQRDGALRQPMPLPLRLISDAAEHTVPASWSGSSRMDRLLESTSVAIWKITT